MAENNFEIEEEIAVLGDYNREGFRTELNKVSWFNRKGRYDIRPWNKDHTLCKKGVSLSNEEFGALREFFKNQ